MAPNGISEFQKPDFQRFQVIFMPAEVNETIFWKLGSKY